MVVGRKWHGVGVWWAEGGIHGGWRHSSGGQGDVLVARHRHGEKLGAGRAEHAKVFVPKPN